MGSAVPHRLRRKIQVGPTMPLPRGSVRDAVACYGDNVATRALPASRMQEHWEFSQCRIVVTDPVSVHGTCTRPMPTIQWQWLLCTCWQNYRNTGLLLAAMYDAAAPRPR